MPVRAGLPPVIAMNAYPYTARTVRRLPQRGLSLVELMVGLTIGMMLTLGLFTLIANTSQSFKVQDDFARLQENATSALRYIGDSVRMGGFYGYAQDPATIDTATGGVATTTDCGSAGNLPLANWALNIGVPVTGFTGLTQANVNTILPCIVAANFVTNSPILITRSAAGLRIPDPNGDGNLTDGMTAQTNYAATIYLQADPNAGIIFYGGGASGFATLKGAGSTRATITGADVDIFQYRAHVYYIRPCSRPAGGVANCTGAGDDAGQPIPTLVRQELVGSVMTEVPLVEGVERIDFRYGIDDTLDGIPDRFTATPAAADWANVVAVKVSVLVRSPTLTAQHNDAAKSYDLDGDGAADYRCIDFPAPACNYKRKVFTQIFQFRNIAQRRGA
jgi:type IV pilus assembly protein PilW